MVEKIANPAGQRRHLANAEAPRGNRGRADANSARDERRLRIVRHRILVHCDVRGTQRGFGVLVRDALVDQVDEEQMGVGTARDDPVTAGDEDRGHRARVVQHLLLVDPEFGLQRLLECDRLGRDDMARKMSGPHFAMISPSMMMESSCRLLGISSPGKDRVLVDKLPDYSKVDILSGYRMPQDAAPTTSKGLADVRQFRDNFGPCGKRQCGRRRPTPTAALDRRIGHGLWFNLVRRKQLRRQFEACWAEAHDLLTIFNKALGTRLLQAAGSVSMSKGLSCWFA